MIADETKRFSPNKKKTKNRGKKKTGDCLEVMIFGCFWKEKWYGSRSRSST